MLYLFQSECRTSLGHSFSIIVASFSKELELDNHGIMSATLSSWLKKRYHLCRIGIRSSILPRTLNETCFLTISQVTLTVSRIVWFIRECDTRSFGSRWKQTNIFFFHSLYGSCINMYESMIRADFASNMFTHNKEVANTTKYSNEWHLIWINHCIYKHQVLMSISERR